MEKGLIPRSRPSEGGPRRSRQAVLKGWMPWLAGLAILAAVAGCGGGASQEEPTSTPLPPVPVLSFDKASVDLGSVPVDQWGIQTFIALNRGGVPLKLGPMHLEAAEGCLNASLQETEVEIGSGQFAVIPIQFAKHTVLGPHLLLVHVPSNDPDRPENTLELRFTVVETTAASGGPGPRLTVDKGGVDIGRVEFEHPMLEVFSLRNDGDQPLVLSEVPTVRVLEGC